MLYDGIFEEIPLRFYSFTNYYLSSIQQGIQPGHVVSEMFVKTPMLTKAAHILRAWAEDHKTWVCLNGGNSADLATLSEELQDLAARLHLPFAAFREDEQSLNGALTSVGLIVPANVYELSAQWRATGQPTELNTPEEQLASLLGRYQLAK